MIPLATARTLSDRHSGQALVEFALILPIFLIILCGCIDLGRWVFAQNELTQAVHAAARGISVEVQGWPATCNGSTAPECATKIVDSKMLAAGGTVATTADCKDPQTQAVVAWVDCAAGDMITVSSVISGWAPITPILSSFLYTSISASTTEPVQ